MFAKELVDLQPDVLLASNTPATGALRRETRMIPIVFPAVADPVGEGFIASISRLPAPIRGCCAIAQSGVYCSARS
jgi:putative ABC transport system substrate-binding protein